MLHSKLLSPNDPPPVLYKKPQRSSPFLVLCDHACSHVPEKLDHLGLNREELERHIAYDLHILDFAEQLANLLDCPLIAAGYSRLVVETNRPLHDPTSMRMISDGTIIPGNIDICTSEKQQRIEEIFHPYHQAISRHLARSPFPPIIVSMHSFTPILRKHPHMPHRIWQLGVLSTIDRCLTDPFLAWIQNQHPQTIVGDNQPYSGNDPYFYTIQHHALRANIPHITFEICQNIEPKSAKGEEVMQQIYDGIQHAVSTLEGFKQKSEI